MAGEEEKKTNDSENLEGKAPSKAPDSVKADPDKETDSKVAPEQSSGDGKQSGADKNAPEPEKTDDPAKKGDPEDKKKDTPKDDPENADDGTEKDGEEITDYPESDDPATQAIIAIFKEKGVAVDVADGIFERALKSGNIEDIDTDALKEQVGEQYATLIMGNVQSIYDNNVKATQTVIKEAHDLLGGEAGWTMCAEWAETRAKSDTAFADELATYKTMIDEGGVQASLALKALTEKFMADPNTTEVPNLEKGDGTAGVTIKPITNKVDFVEQLKEAYKKGDDVAMANIRRARALGRKLEKNDRPIW